MLDGILKPDKYAVYVQVQMKPDAKVLQEYYDEKAITSMPGVPIPDPEVDSPANNKLYSMVQSKKVIVVLDKAVSGEQELVAKEVLKAKLAINDKKGDSIDIRRADVPNASDRSPASAGSSTSTENWVKYFLISLAAALAFATALLLWQVSILRERVDARAKLKADIKVDTSMDTSASTILKNAGPLNTEGAEGSEGASSGGGGGSGRSRGIQESDPISAAELKEKILALAVSQPKACSLVARKLMATREGMRKLAVACEAIGFEYTRQLFDTVSPARWRAMGEYLRENLGEISKAPVGPILLEIYTDMLAESMGWDPSQSSEGPFDFIHKISEPELVKLLANEDPAHIAFIAAYWEPEEMSQILTVLTETRRKETILQIARLKALPREVVQQAAIHFAQRLKTLRGRNEVEVNGSEVVAKMLGNVDSNTEEELLRFIEREDPATRDRLRSHYFSFDSLTLLPQDLLQAVVDQIDPSEITKALAGADEPVIQAVLAVLPPKQRAIVEDDVRIAGTQNTIPKQETSVARKHLVVELRKAMKDRGIELASLVGGSPDQQQEQGYVPPASAYQQAPSFQPAPAFAPPATASPLESPTQPLGAPPTLTALDGGGGVAEAAPADSGDGTINIVADDDQAA